MKAIKKKYGKKRWEDTPNAAWYRKRQAAAKFFNLSASNIVATMSYSQIQKIRESDMPNHEKAYALANAIISANINIMKAGATYKKPDPNPSASK